MKAIGKVRSNPVRCCDPVLYATFKRERLVEIGLRHVRCRRVGQLDPIDPDLWYATGRRELI